MPIRFTFLVVALFAVHDVEALSSNAGTRRGHAYAKVARRGRLNLYKAKAHNVKRHAVKEMHGVEPDPAALGEDHGFAWLRRNKEQAQPAFLGVGARILRSRGKTHDATQEKVAFGKGNAEVKETVPWKTQRVMTETGNGMVLGSGRGVTHKSGGAAGAFPEIQSGEEFARDFVEDDDDLALREEVERERKDNRRTHTIAMAVKAQELQLHSKAAERKRRIAMATEAAELHKAERAESRKVWAERELALQREHFDVLNQEKATLAKAMETARNANSKAKEVLRQTEDATRETERHMVALERKEKDDRVAFRMSTQDLHNAEQLFREKASDTNDAKEAMIEAEKRLGEYEKDLLPGVQGSVLSKWKLNTETNANASVKNTLSSQLEEGKEVVKRDEQEQVASTTTSAPSTVSQSPSQTPEKKLQDTIASAGESEKSFGTEGTLPQASTCLLLPLLLAMVS